MSSEEADAVEAVRALRRLGHSDEKIRASGLIPPRLVALAFAALTDEVSPPVEAARCLDGDGQRQDWVSGVDRRGWYYWPQLREFLISSGKWDQAAIRSLDGSSEQVLCRMGDPGAAAFDVRGLALGYVQSGKTANYTAVIAKAADAGYRLVIVLAGMDNGLRLQTNARLKRELVGYPDGRTGCVPMPPLGRQWHEFTRDEFNGDFQPGYVNHGALQGTQPVLLVVKKNGTVLRRLLEWLNRAPAEALDSLPTVVIDDEADLGSVDTRGAPLAADDPPPADYEPPSVVNGLIRGLLGHFRRCCYLAYTATPFANILIPHDAVDPSVGSDLYPKDFIIDLPKPAGYFGAEEFFGKAGSGDGGGAAGLDAVRRVPETEIAQLYEGALPPSLRCALVDFVLGGAARALRGCGAEPSTMLIHTSQKILDHSDLWSEVEHLVGAMRDDWRYQRTGGILEEFRTRWDAEFYEHSRAIAPGREVPFEQIEPHVGRFFEALQVKQVNSATGEVLDYSRDPSLKAVVVGGNRLSRGLTLEGLSVSYFVRRSATYDTLMQMGRWFGFRGGYEDLVRIYTTSELEGWFFDLAGVERRLREDLAVYEGHGLTPSDAGMRIWQHPAMQVTSPLKRRFASMIVST